MAAATSFCRNCRGFGGGPEGFWLRAERGINTRKRRRIGAEVRIVNGPPKYIRSSGILSVIHLMSAFDSVVCWVIFNLEFIYARDFICNHKTPNPALGCDRRTTIRSPPIPFSEYLVKINRRELVKNLTLASGAAALGASWPLSKTTSARTTLPNLPNPGNSRIDHVVVVTMENRSFDHFLGWLPNADGKQAGLTYRDKQGIAHHT